MRRLSSGPLALLGGALAATLTLTGTAAAQLASRPADEWVTVLDSPERLAGLKIHEVAASLELDRGDVVADLGAGSGPFVVPFAAHVGDEGTVYAVDIDRGFFPHIERRAKAAGVTNVRTVLGEASDPKLPSAGVDVAFFHDVLHHVENRPLYLKSLLRYLEPDARVAIIDYNPAQSPHQNEPSLQVSKEQATAWMAEIGFKPLYEVPLFKDKWFVVYRR